MSLTHASCVKIKSVGILIRGVPGAGKSNLCLRLIKSHGANLVADDQVHLSRIGQDVQASSPLALQGLLEVRGLGLVKFPFITKAKLHLIIDLCPAQLIERLPTPDSMQQALLGQTFPRIFLDATLPQATSVLLAAIQHFKLQT